MIFNFVRIGMLFHSWHQCTLSRNRDIEGESNSLYNMNCVHYSMIFRKDGDITTPSERKHPEGSTDDTCALFKHNLLKDKRQLFDFDFELILNLVLFSVVKDRSRRLSHHVGCSLVEWGCRQEHTTQETVASIKIAIFIYSGVFVKPQNIQTQTDQNPKTHTEQNKSSQTGKVHLCTHNRLPAPAFFQ